MHSASSDFDFPRPTCSALFASYTLQLRMHFYAWSFCLEGILYDFTVNFEPHVFPIALPLSTAFEKSFSRDNHGQKCTQGPPWLDNRLRRWFHAKLPAMIHRAAPFLFPHRHSPALSAFDRRRDASGHLPLRFLSVFFGMKGKNRRADGHVKRKDEPESFGRRDTLQRRWGRRRGAARHFEKLSKPACCRISRERCLPNGASCFAVFPSYNDVNKLFTTNVDAPL